jgi:HK97 family phage prohead protease
MTVERRSAALMLDSSERSASAAMVRVGGLGVPYDTDSLEMPFIEQFAPGSFRDQVGDDFAGVTGQFMHDQVLVLASVDSGTMIVTDGPLGLQFRMSIPTSLAYVSEVVASGIVAGASIGFRVLKDQWSADPDGTPRRFVTRAQLIEISLVSRPAYLDAKVAVRGALRPAEDRAGKVLSLKTRETLLSVLGHIRGGRHSEAVSVLASLLNESPDESPLLDMAKGVAPARRAQTLSLEEARRKIADRERARLEDDLRRHQMRVRWDKVRVEG